jgi:c(7)-type cytochrome triheme protein
MRAVAGVVVCLSLLIGLAVVAAEAPDKMVYESKLGNVTFDHKKHTERVKNDCKACHDKLFPQAKAPLNYKEKMHRVAEEKRISCAGCHHPGGTAFESKGNCNKCHIKAPAKA